MSPKHACKLLNKIFSYHLNNSSLKTYLKVFVILPFTQNTYLHSKTMRRQGSQGTLLLTWHCIAADWRLVIWYIILNRKNNILNLFVMFIQCCICCHNIVYKIILFPQKNVYVILHHFKFDLKKNLIIWHPLFLDVININKSTTAVLMVRYYPISPAVCLQTALWDSSDLKSGLDQCNKTAKTQERVMDYIRSRGRKAQGLRLLGINVKNIYIYILWNIDFSK